MCHADVGPLDWNADSTLLSFHFVIAASILHPHQSHCQCRGRWSKVSLNFTSYYALLCSAHRSESAVVIKFRLEWPLASEIPSWRYRCCCRSFWCQSKIDFLCRQVFVNTHTYTNTDGERENVVGSTLQPDILVSFHVNSNETLLKNENRFGLLGYLCTVHWECFKLSRTVWSIPQVLHISKINVDKFAFQEIYKYPISVIGNKPRKKCNKILFFQYWKQRHFDCIQIN